MTVRLAVSGAQGRMGMMVAQLAAVDDRFEVVQLLEKDCRGDASPPSDIDLGLDACLKPSTDVLVDFTDPEGFRVRLTECVQGKVAFVSGTTGLDQGDMDLLVDASSVIPVLHAPNMSLGIEILSRAVSLVSSLLPPGFDAEVTETHHRQKLDAPSGTALRIVEVLTGVAKSDEAKLVLGRHGKTAARSADEIGVHALRGGDVIGEHTVHFFGAGERIEVTHRCSDRAVFARGALQCALHLAGASPGRYGVADAVVPSR